MEPRYVTANNPGPFTLAGTRTYLVGRERVAIIDPGPDLESHVRALQHAVAGAESVQLLLTHGHDDHAGAAGRLSQALAAEVVGVGHATARRLEPGEAVQTDAGRLVALDTPGHSREHVTFHWVEAEAAFPGDLVLGAGSTTWVGEYAGCVADYLDSLNRVRELECRILYPAHGPAIEDPASTLDLFEEHRRRRIRQIREALAADPEATSEELVAVVYGSSIPEGLETAARLGVEAILDFLV